jgi:1-acyl-sn-glycerol-3-phosphate acyltransferase
MGRNYESCTESGRIATRDERTYHDGDLTMIVCEADAAAMRSYSAYAVADSVVKPLLNTLGGYAAGGVEQVRPLDGEGYFAVPNHLSNWDHFLLGQVMLDLPDLSRQQEPDLDPLQPRGLHWMAKESLWDYPVVKQFVELCNAFPVERGTGKGLPPHLVEYIGMLMDSNAVLVMYPQGRRVRGPESQETLVQDEFRSTIAFLALKYGKPVLPVGLAGPVKGPKFPRALVFEEPIFVEQMDPEDPNFKAAKAALMEEIYRRVNSGYQQARQLHQEQFPEPTSWLDLANRLANSPVGAATMAGLSAGAVSLAGKKLTGYSQRS